MTGEGGGEGEKRKRGSEWSSTIEEMSCQANGSCPVPEKPINLTATINEQQRRQQRRQQRSQQAVTLLQAQERSHAERRELS